MGGFLALGFLIGMQHALEADHLAAVGAMAAGQRNSKRSLVMRGAAWGLGHTITLLVISTAVILLGMTLTDEAAALLEFGVGVMLVLLGIDVLRRMRRQKVHFHLHDHGTGRAHLHAHSHAHAAHPHSSDPHHHAHPEGFPLRALLVGLMHGAAGSAGLLLLTVAATRDPIVAIGYVVLFGLGSILGMAALSYVAAWPLGAVQRKAAWLHKGLGLAAAAVAIGLGISVISESAALAWEAF